VFGLFFSGGCSIRAGIANTIHYDLTGKTNERLAPSCKGAKLMDGKVFKGSVGHQELAAWAEGLGL